MLADRDAGKQAPSRARVRSRDGSRVEAQYALAGMQTEELTVQAPDGVALHVYHWSSDTGAPPKAIVHIAHGMAEHAGRYARLAEALVAAGYEVYADDHRGHGKTAKTDADLGFFTAKDGWRTVVDDLKLHIRRAAERHPGKPVVLVAHSMGSFLAQQAIAEIGDQLAAVVLSGSNGKPPAIAAAGKLVARIERMRLGPHGRSNLLTALSFDDWNKKFKPNRTAFDWLSRDEKEVDKYAADPRCGFKCTTQMWVDLLDALGPLADPALQSRVPKSLPVFVIAGSEDAVSDRTKGLQQLLGAYRTAGLRRVSHKFYPNARHEVFNETNRDEVTRDVIAFLDGAVTRAE